MSNMIDKNTGHFRPAPDGKSPLTYIEAVRDESDPENRGRSAQVFEDYNSQHNSEFGNMMVLGVWAIAFLAVAAALVVAPLMIRAIAAVVGG